MKPKGILSVFILFSMLLISMQPLLAQTFDTTIKVVYPPVGGNANFDRIDKSKVPEITPRKVDDSLLWHMQQDDAFWYANAAIAKKETPQTSSAFNSKFFNQKWVKPLLWILIIGSFIALITWYISGLNPKLFCRQPAALKSLNNEAMPDDIFSIAYEKQIEDAEQNEAYAQAVRLQYLQTLSLLTVTKKIRYDAYRPNKDYLFQLYNTSFYNDFAKLTRHFEFVCYGRFSLTAASYQKLQKEFKAFHQQLSI